MANTATTGAKNLGSTGVLYDERRDFYIRPNVVKELWTDVAPFLTVVANQGTISGMADPIFKMFEHRNPWQKQQFKLNDAVGTDAVLETGNAGSAEALTLDTTASSYEGIELGENLVGLTCEVYNEAMSTKKGVVLIMTYSSGAITVKNMGSANITLADNDMFQVVGNAQGEGTGSPVAWADDLEVVYNSTQIFKTPVEITGTLLQASLRGESKELARLRDQKSAEHKIQKERAFLFGANPQGIKGGTFGTGHESILDAGDKVVRTTMGIIPALEKHGVSDNTKYNQNVFASGDIDSYSEFVDAMEKVFQYVPTVGMKRAFVGAGALGYWSKMANGSGFASNSGWTVNIGDMKRDALGFNYRTLETPHGVLQMIPTPALRGYYNKHMVIVDSENLFHAQYRAPKFEASIQANDADLVKDQYFSDEGIGISMIESHSMMVTP